MEMCICVCVEMYMCMCTQKCTRVCACMYRNVCEYRLPQKLEEWVPEPLKVLSCPGQVLGMAFCRTSVRSQLRVASLGQKSIFY